MYKRNGGYVPRSLFYLGGVGRDVREEGEDDTFIRKKISRDLFASIWMVVNKLTERSNSFGFRGLGFF